MNLDGRGVANFILDTCDSAGRPITNLALQKILYFCHGWYLAKTNEPLIRHSFEAWQYGPVLQYLYSEFKEFEANPITKRAHKLNFVTGQSEIVDYEFDTATEELLSEVIRFYGRLSPGTLVELSHVDDGPWHRAWSAGAKINPGMRIENDYIYKFFSEARVPF